MNKPLFFVTMFFILCSCRSNEKYEQEGYALDTIFINPKNISEDRINYSTLFDSISYILMPEDTSFLIGRVDKLLVTDDYIFILDQKITHSVFGIDKDGNKALHINAVGVAPGEYLFMTDIAYEANKKELLIHCKMKKKILHYDLKGNFLYEKEVPYNIRKFCPINNSFAYYCEYYENHHLKKDNYSPNVFLLDSSSTFVPQNAVSYFIPPINQAIVWNSNCQFSRWKDTVSIKPDHGDIIYHITSNRIIPRYKLDFGLYSIDNRYWELVKQNDVKIEKLHNFINDSGICESFWFFESHNYMYFTFRQRGNKYDVLYSKKTAKMYNLRYYNNDMDKVTLFNPIAMHNDKLYCLLNSEDIYNMKSELIKYLPKDILEKVEEFGNPIIAVFTLKSF